MEIIKLNLIPSGVNPTCHCSQYDEGRVIRIELFDGLTPYTLQSGDTVTLNVRKPDNTIVTASITATQGNKYVDIVTTEQICACVGYNLCDLTITNGSVVIGTLNFIMAIERDVLADGIPSQSVIEDLEELVQEAVGDNYYTKTETDDLLDAKADKSTTYTKTQVDDALALKANSSDVYTKAQADSLLNDKADKSTTYTKTETDTALALKADKATTYTKTETDTLLNAKANSSDVYTKAQVDTALEGKADVDGEYKLMTVGNAEQLKSTVGEINKTPYNFRTSGGSLDIGDREVDKIVGGTVAFNQLALFLQNQIPSNNNGITYAYTDGTSVKCNGTATSNELRSGWFGLSESSGFKNNIGHRVIIITKVISGTSSSDVYFGWDSTPNNKIGTSIISTVPSSDQRRFYYNIPNGVTCNDYIFTINVFDLTQMFGSTIADYIYNLEQGTAGAGVAWFKKLFPKSYYAYNAGELMSVKTSAHNTVGFNAYNNATGKAKLLGGVEYQITGAYTSLAYTDINGDSETITPDSNGKFTPTNNGELTVTGGNATDTCVHIVWDGERDGDFEPYELNSYALDPDLELRGIPKLDANNQLYYDGDEYESSGDVTRRFAIVNLGSLEWQYSTTYKWFNPTTASFPPASIKAPSNSGIANVLMINGFYTVSRDTLANDLTLDKRCCVNSGGYFIVRDLAYSDAATFKTAMNGVYLVYELATPTTEQADPFTNPQIVNDFGTEEYVDTRDVAIPVGHDTFYQANLRAKLEMAPDSPENNGDYLMRHNNGENTYIPYTSPIPSAPTTDGTYTLKATVSGGTPTLTWVQDT